MSELRQVQESPLVQGENEKLTYTLTVTPWGSGPSGTAVTAWDVTGGGKEDVSAAVLFGDPVTDGDIITLPSLENLTAGHVYRIEIQWLSGGNTFECYVLIEGEP